MCIEPLNYTETRGLEGWNESLVWGERKWSVHVSYFFVKYSYLCIKIAQIFCKGERGNNEGMVWKRQGGVRVFLFFTVSITLIGQKELNFLKHLVEGEE